MDINTLDISISDIKSLEDKLFTEDERLQALAAIREIDCYCEFPEVE